MPVVVAGELVNITGPPVVATVGQGITFNDKSSTKYKVDEPSLRPRITQQVAELAGHPEIVWWAIQPEDLHTGGIQRAVQAVKSGRRLPQTSPESQLPLINPQT